MNSIESIAGKANDEGAERRKGRKESKTECHERRKEKREAAMGRNANLPTSSGGSKSQEDPHRRPPPSGEDWEAICGLMRRFTLKNNTVTRPATVEQEKNTNRAHRSIGMMMSLVAEAANPFKSSDVKIEPFVVIVRDNGCTVISLKEHRARRKRRRYCHRVHPCPAQKKKSH